MSPDIFKRGIKRLQDAFPKRSIIPGFFWEQLKEIPDKSFIDVVLAITKDPENLHPKRDLIEAIKYGAQHILNIKIQSAELISNKQRLEKWKAERAETIPKCWTDLKNKLKPCQNQPS